MEVRGTFTTPRVPFYSPPLSCTIAIYSIPSETEYKKKKNDSKYHNNPIKLDLICKLLMEKNR